MGLYDFGSSGGLFSFGILTLYQHVKRTILVSAFIGHHALERQLCMPNPTHSDPFNISSLSFVVFTYS